MNDCKVNDTISSSVPCQRFALGIEYLGSGFIGWQKQNFPCRTVQAVLNTAISRVANQPIDTVCAGRTDTGVHAFAQVVHFETDAQRSERAWLKGINRYLPDDVSVNWVCPVADDFHARFSARARRYCYVMSTVATPRALLAGRVWFIQRALSVPTMQAAANHLLGRQDFTSFRSIECQAHNAIRHIHFIRIIEHQHWIVIDIQANAFLHHMVRNIVGSLEMVGDGRRDVDWFTDVLQAKNRHLAGPTAPANGLYLVDVSYDCAYNFPCPEHPFPFLDLTFSI